MRRFTPEQRSAFMRFVWGRSRLPASAAEWGDMKLTIHTKHTAQPDRVYPVAHTCFFSLELPAYSSAAHCYERLLYAITHCTQVRVRVRARVRVRVGLQ